ncbi:hypothetical protein HYR54_00420 [Candidatus Acetothermia bacterium]|nr:hypothetical protein [Candidatus Acetothermia bacterium]
MRGFLPSQDPLERLPEAYEIWDQIGSEVSALLMTGKLRSTLERLSSHSLGELKDLRQQERALLILSVLANAYVWAGEKPATRIPQGVASHYASLPTNWAVRRSSRTLRSCSTTGVVLTKTIPLISIISFVCSSFSAESMSSGFTWLE